MRSLNREKEHAVPTQSRSVLRPEPARARAVIACAGALVACAGLALVGTGPNGGESGGKQGGSGQANGSPAGALSGAMSLELYECQVMDFDITTAAAGDIRAAKQIDVRNTLDTESTVIEIIAEGTSVKAGDVLVKLNDEPIQQRMDEEKLSLETSRAQVVEAEEGYQIQLSENESAKRAAELKLSLAKLEFDQWIDGELMSKQQDLEHNLERAEKEEARLREKLDKSTALFAKGYYSLDQLKQDELQWEQAVNTLAKAQLDKDVFWDYEYPKQRKRKESDVEEAAAELERVTRQNQSRLASKQAGVNNAKQTLSLRESKFSKYREQLESTTIKAPSDGLVVYATSVDNSRWGNDEGPLQVGSKVFPNQNIIVLPDTSEMVASVRVHESLASKIRPGQTAVVKVEAAGAERYTGVVESIGILAEQTSRWMDPNLREYTVRIMLNLPKGGGGEAPSDSSTIGPKKSSLKPSMRCEAEIMLGSVSQALAVPTQAIFNEGPLRYVHVQDGQRFRRRPVRVGQRSDRYASIAAGLSAGDRVLLRKPLPAEVINQAWNPGELAAVGLGFNEQGQVVPVEGSAGTGGARGGGAGGGGGGGGGGGAGGGRGGPGKKAGGRG